MIFWYKIRKEVPVFLSLSCGFLYEPKATRSCPRSVFQQRLSSQLNLSHELYQLSKLDWLGVFRERILRAFRWNSGAAAWCREEGISYSTFQYWRKFFNKQKSQADKNSFVEIPYDSFQGWIEILLRGAKLTISKDFDRGALLFCLKLLGGHWGWLCRERRAFFFIKFPLICVKDSRD